MLPPLRHPGHHVGLDLLPSPPQRTPRTLPAAAGAPLRESQADEDAEGFRAGEGEIVADPPLVVGARRQRLPGPRMQVVAEPVEGFPGHRARQAQLRRQLAAPPCRPSPGPRQ